jgi:hypothetical protein
MSNATDAVPVERIESEGASNNISGSEHLSLKTRPSPASENEVGNFESQNWPNQEVRKERPKVSYNISGSERLSLMTRTSPASEDKEGKCESPNLPDQEVRNEATNGGERHTDEGCGCGCR